MRALIQRVGEAAVEVDGRIVGKIGRGLLVFLGVGRGDDAEAARRLAEKVVRLRVFPDESRSMQRSIADIGGEILLISQFTLYADCRKGRRPSFEAAETPERAEALYREFASLLVALGHLPQEGVFGAHMKVRLENDGPVTILLDSAAVSDAFDRQ